MQSSCAQYWHKILENGRFSDRNRIAANSHVSNRIEIYRNKWRLTSIPDILKSMNSDTCRPCDDQGRSHFKYYSPVSAISAKQAADVWCRERAAINSRHVDPPQLRLALSGRGSKLRRYKLSIVDGVKCRRFKPLISCRCWRGSCKHATHLA